MTAADWNPALPPEVRRANEIAAEQHAAKMEALQTRIQTERDKNADRAANDAAFAEYLAENRRRKADPWADQPDDVLTPTAAIDKMRARAHADREAVRDTKFASHEAEIAARNENHQANARAMQEWCQQAYEERLEQLSEVAAERDRRAETTATIDEMRRHRSIGL